MKPFMIPSNRRLCCSQICHQKPWINLFPWCCHHNCCEINPGYFSVTAIDDIFIPYRYSFAQCFSYLSKNTVFPFLRCNGNVSSYSQDKQYAFFHQKLYQRCATKTTISSHQEFLIRERCSYQIDQSRNQSLLNSVL